MNTEEQLVLKYGPVVPLADICGPVFGISASDARRKAGVNALPVPTFKMRDSERAPLLVRASHLAEYIDAQTTAAEDSWKKSQV